jgi:drug/metabolite transporter (DMT)-like permease
MEITTQHPKWKTLLAFAIIYFVWGSTFLAIRVGVREVPPFLFAAMRFFVAGLALYGWMLGKGERSPNGRQWASAFLLALLIFVLDYGLLFWAEQRVPSGIAAVMMATIPVFMALSRDHFPANTEAYRSFGFGAADRTWGSGGADEQLLESWRSAGR